MSTTSPREEFKPSQCKEVNEPTSQQLWMFIPHHPMSTHPPGRCSSYNLLFQMFRFNFSLSEWWDWKGVEQRITGADSQSPAVEGELDRGRLGLGGAWVVCTVLIWRVVDHIDGGFTAAAGGGGCVARMFDMVGYWAGLSVLTGWNSANEDQEKLSRWLFHSCLLANG